jgi:hypothetical protein
MIEVDFLVTIFGIWVIGTLLVGISILIYTERNRFLDNREYISVIIISILWPLAFAIVMIVSPFMVFATLSEMIGKNNREE